MKIWVEIVVNVEGGGIRRGSCWLLSGLDYSTLDSRYLADNGISLLDHIIVYDQSV